MKNVTKKIGSLLLILALVSQLFTPLATYAQTDQAAGQQTTLFQVDEALTLEDTLILEPGTLLYGEQIADEQAIEIQYGIDKVTISEEFVTEVEIPLEESPVYVEESLLEASEQHLFAAEQDFYSTDAAEVQLSTVREMAYPVYRQADLDMPYIVLGNIAFYVTEEAVIKDISTEVPAEDVEQEEISEQEANEAATVATFSVKAAQTNAWANSKANYFQVAVDNLTVYSKGNTKQIGTLTKGEVYTIDANYGNWHQIQFGNVKAYVRKASTTPSNGQQLKNKNTNYKQSNRVVTALQNVPVYDNTSGKLVRFGTINKGETYPIATDYGSWWRIIFADRVGYINKSNVRGQLSSSGTDTKTNTGTHFNVLESNLAVYDNRSGSLKQVGSLTKGQEYQIVSDYGNWHRIQYNNFFGYVRKASTEPTNGASIRNKNINYKHTDRSFTADRNVVVYDNSGGSLRGFGTILKGQSYYIAGDYGKWWRIVFADRVGYVNKEQVRFNFFNTDKYFEVTINNLPVYDNSNGTLKKIGELTKGQTYPRVNNNGGNWHRVNFGEGYGYVPTLGTDLGTKSRIPNLNTAFKHQPDKIVGGKSTPIYDNSSGKNVPFGKLEEDVIYPIASDYGNWWRVIYLDRVGFVRKSDVDVYGIIETNYDITLDQAVALQAKVRGQTDKNYRTYVSKDHIDANNKVTADSLNVRGGPGAGHWVVGTLKEGDAVEIINESNGWYEIEYTKNNRWVNASPTDIKYYLNPLNFVNDNRLKFQFLDLSRSSDAPANVLNGYLQGKGVLHGHGQTFLDASRIHKVNDIYLVAHAFLETGHGSSTLATGKIEVGQVTNNKWVAFIPENNTTVAYTGELNGTQWTVKREANFNRSQASNIRKTYNMFGIGAVDSAPEVRGSIRAYQEGWFDVKSAIIGGAKFIGEDYIHNQYGQNTLYKMRWNPNAMANLGYATKQYATDIGWAAKQVNTIVNIYDELDSYTIYLDIPVYR